MDKKPQQYWVWRRSDGYVAGTAYHPKSHGSRDEFEILLVTEDWHGGAVPLIESHPVPDHMK